MIIQVCDEDESLYYEVTEEDLDHIKGIFQKHMGDRFPFYPSPSSDGEDWEADAHGEIRKFIANRRKIIPDAYLSIMWGEQYQFNLGEEKYGHCH